MNLKFEIGNDIIDYTKTFPPKISNRN